MDEPSRSFTLFPDLPSELRLKIWGYIAPGPRNVSIRYKTEYNTIGGRARAVWTGWKSPDPVPIVLQISHESREEALKTYQRAFGTVFNEPRIYFNYAIDTLCFGAIPGTHSATDTRWGSPGASGYLLDVLLGGSYHGAFDTEKVRFMSIDIPEDLYARKSFCWDEIRELTGLKELTLMAWDEDAMKENLMAHYKETLTTVSTSHPEWVVPRVTAVSALSWEIWGVVTKSTE